MDSVAIPTMHRIGPRGERLSVPTPIRSVAGALPVYHVGGDRQDRLSVQGMAIRWILPKLVHECADDPRSELVYSIVVVAKLREVTSGLIVRHEPGFIANHSNFRVTDGRQAVGNDGHPCHAEGHGS